MEFRTAGLALALLLLGSAVGLFLQRLLKERHRTHETGEAIRLVVTILATFAALVLGLLVTSVKADFDEHNDMYRQYGSALIRLDTRMRLFGEETAPIRSLLRQFTATVISNTFPGEPRPTGSYQRAITVLTRGSDESREITALLGSIDRAVESLDPATLYQRNVFPIIEDSLRRVEDIRWRLVEGATSRLSSVFLATLMFWLVTIFLIFGLIAPRNGLVYTAFFLSSLSIASTIYLTLDLDTGFGGLIQISSDPLREALLHMDQPP